MRVPVTVSCLLVSLFAGACDYPVKVPPHGTVPDAADSDQPEVVAPAVTWHRDVRPIVEQHCNGCHAEGGIAPSSFEDLDQILGIAPVMVGYVKSGEMPPWPMDPTCRDVRDARLLSAADKAVFQGWADAGYAVGDTADYVAPAPASASPVGAHGLALTRSDGYAPDIRKSDDYRCFLFPQALSAASWIRGVRIDPDEKPLVHHVLLFMVPPEQVAALVAKDDETRDVPGYPCQGGSGATGDTMVAGWVPGSVPTLFPETGAIEAPAGARFVMQMHYNTLNVDKSQTVPSDTTGGWLELLPAGETPSHVIAIRPVLDPTLKIAANDPAAVEGMSFTTRWSGQVVGVAPHMHTRGSEIRVRKTDTAGAETCIAEIPEWDFHWQQTYVFEPGSYVPFSPGDKVAIECIYDNGADNQPVIDGTAVVPTEVTWGEETTDEMCLAYLMVMTPYTPTSEPAGACEAFGPCYATCAAGDAACAVQCLVKGGTECMQCGLSEMFLGCGEEQCPTEADALTTCLAGCAGNKLQCAMAACKDESAALYACLETPLRRGFCDGPCGIAVTP